MSAFVSGEGRSVIDELFGADLKWVTSEAACVQAEDIDRAFFAETGKNYHRARTICNTCPLQQPCLEYALTHEVDGLWAGTSITDRNRLRAGLPLDPTPTTPRTLRPCGTRAAYRRHLANGEPVDKACAEAGTAARRTFREKSRP